MHWYADYLVIADLRSIHADLAGGELTDKQLAVMLEAGRDMHMAALKVMCTSGGAEALAGYRQALTTSYCQTLTADSGHMLK
jgi:hypothetical protein